MKRRIIMAKVVVEREDNVLIMEFNRPEKKNAIDVEMYMELAAAYGELQRDSELRCGLLCAKGDHFSTGLDLMEWAPFMMSGKMPDMPEGSIDPLGLDESKRITKPLVMAVQGFCYTVGIEMLLASDIRVAATSASFNQFEIKRGLYPIGGATTRMIREIGWGNAMRYLLTADVMSAEEAYRMGLVQELVAPGEERKKALNIAKTVAKQAPIGVRATLKSARIARLQGEIAAVERLYDDMELVSKSQDFQEGILSFMERREAKFKDC